MQLEQRLFVLHDGLISQWGVGPDGELDCITCNGRREVSYDASRANEGWKAWAEDEQVGEDDRFDAIFLTDDPCAFSDLPIYFTVEEAEQSSWTLEMIAKVLQEPEFQKFDVRFIQGNKDVLMGAGGNERVLKLSIVSTLRFELPDAVSDPISADVEEAQHSEQPVVCADSYGDKKALALKVGDSITVKISVIALARRCYYATSEALDDLVKFKMSDLKDGVSFVMGQEIQLVVVAIEELRVDYALV